MDKLYSTENIPLNNQELNFSEIDFGYYLVSKKWSLPNDKYITFVRNTNLAYCYNLNWAGTKSLHELEQFVKDDSTVIIHFSLIKIFIKKVSIGENESFFRLPNTVEVRRAIGFN